MLEKLGIIIVVVISVFCLLNRKNNVFPIIKQQFKIYKDYRNNKVHMYDVFVFLLAPIALSFILVLMCKALIPYKVIEPLITIISIVFGLFLSFIAVLLPSMEIQYNDKMNLAIKETFICALYCMILSLIILMLNLVYISLEPERFNIHIFSIFSYILYYELLFCVLLLIKRIYNIYF